MSSKLVKVRQVLEGNEAIVIVHSKEEKPGSERGIKGWSQFVTFWVAPRARGIYAPAELQQLMMSLVPDLQFTYKSDCGENSALLWFGDLCFDEKIGQETKIHEVIITDENFLPSPQFPETFVDGKYVKTEIKDLCRRTLIRIFPDVLIARRDASGEKGIRTIYKQEIREYAGR